MNEDILELSRVFNKRGFKTYACDNRDQVNELISKIISENEPIKSIGIGNSLTLKSIGTSEMLLRFTENIYIHEPIGTERTDRLALASDFYLTSANAVSLDGCIVNIDGTGNRTAATCFGPKNIIYVIGKNKITKSLDEAIIRAKNTAVELAKRYNRKTPCVISGKCEDCISPGCICAITTIHRKKPYGINIFVILADEDLGI
ncbi:MAG: lactate utilization protein [Saccharofermentanales bacterium]